MGALGAQEGPQSFEVAVGPEVHVDHPIDAVSHVEPLRRSQRIAQAQGH